MSYELHDPDYSGTTEEESDPLPQENDFDTDDLGEIADHFLSRRRRRLLRTTAAVGAAGFAGCLGIGGSGQTMEVLHDWTGSAGAPAIETLIQGFNAAHPDIDATFEAIDPGSNTTLDTRISNRAKSGSLPSTWADWPGKNLVQFSSANQLGDIGEEVWTDERREAYSEEAKRYSQIGSSADSIGDGPYVAVPIGSHRMNDLFYNVTVVEEAGVDPTSLSTPEDLVDAFEQVEQNTDAVGMAQAWQGPFTTLQLWEVVMQGQAGHPAFMRFINGNGDEEPVRSAFETVQQYAQYYNSDVSSIGFREANRKFMNDRAAFVQTGNWVAGAYRNQEGFEYETDWNRVPFPGTEDMYGMHLDAFPFPANGPASEDTKIFLSYVGSTDAQIRFNRSKGSIPLRTDVDTEEFGPYLTQTIEDYDSITTKPPTIAYGLALEPGIRSTMYEIITHDFHGSGDINAATRRMLDAAPGNHVAR